MLVNGDGKLVGGFKHFFCNFPCHIWDVILPKLTFIVFKMVKTTNQGVSWGLQQ